MESFMHFPRKLDVCVLRTTEWAGLPIKRGGADHVFRNLIALVHGVGECPKRSSYARMVWAC